jgi:hypothetical protein
VTDEKMKRNYGISAVRCTALAERGGMMEEGCLGSIRWDKELGVFLCDNCDCVYEKVYEDDG